MKPDVDQGIKDQLKIRLSWAQNIGFFYFAVKNPTQKSYQNMCGAVDQYLEVFRQAYDSLQEYIDDQDAALKVLAARKGMNQQSSLIAIDERQKSRIQLMDEAIFRPAPHKYFSHETFANWFVMTIPSAYEKAAKMFESMPDKPLPALSAAPEPTHKPD
ncbi:MAG: hypothetical protein HYS17_10905 [Micavibrio aeruginosavorus]|uniref:Uncharacterized protein n=1 Tax=Micavibrio aeruginosavorus TaxID=349221 RepID=A0A7T5R1U7_9BACT|nr:MAG: hypothetical protein HYS17_10905 [Micavibrio aeruginosavorus]